MGDGFNGRTAARVATTGSITIASDLNTGDLVDGVTLVADDRVLVKDQGSTEVTEFDYSGFITPTPAAAGRYFTLASPQGSYYIWFTDGTNTDPTPGGTGIEVNVSGLSDNAQRVAQTVATVNQFFDFQASALGDVLVIKNTLQGAVTDAADVDSGVSPTVTQQGTAGLENGVYIVGATPARSEDFESGTSILNTFIWIRDGERNGGSSFVSINPTTLNVLDTDTLTFARYDVAKPLSIERGGYGGTTLGDTANRILYTPVSGVVSTIETVADQVLIGSSTGIPEFSTTIPTSINLRQSFDLLGTARFSASNLAFRTFHRFAWDDSLYSGRWTSGTLTYAWDRLTGTRSFTIEVFDGTSLASATKTTPGDSTTGVDSLTIPTLPSADGLLEFRVRRNAVGNPRITGAQVAFDP